jgi:hypothetical protein
MIYVSIIGFFAVDLGVREGANMGAKRAVFWGQNQAGRQAKGSAMALPLRSETMDG